MPFPGLGRVDSSRMPVSRLALVPSGVRVTRHRVMAWTSSSARFIGGKEVSTHGRSPVVGAACKHAGIIMQVATTMIRVAGFHVFFIQFAFRSRELHAKVLCMYC